MFDGWGMLWKHSFCGASFHDDLRLLALSVTGHPDCGASIDTYLALISEVVIARLVMGEFLRRTVHINILSF